MRSSLPRFMRFGVRKEGTQTHRMIAAEKFKVTDNLIFGAIYPGKEERPILRSGWGVADQMVQRQSSRFWIPIVEKLEELDVHVGHIWLMVLSRNYFLLLLVALP